MDHLPLNDIPMLVSSVNSLLRDGEFEDLDEICSYFDVDRSFIDSLLASAGYSYDTSRNRII